MKRLPRTAPRWQPTAVIVIATVWLGSSLMACGTAGESNDPSRTTSPSSSTVTARNEVTSTTKKSDREQSTKGEDMVAVIVDLSVEWQPEAQLDSKEAVADQREAIRDAQAAVVEMLEGTEFEVTRLYQSTPQMALRVDAEGLDRLHESVLVEKVNEDEPDPPSG